MRIELVQDTDRTVIRVSGRINFEGTHPLRKRIRALPPSDSLVVDLSEADFIGSTNIGTFFQVVRDVATTRSVDRKLKVRGASREFIRLFALYDNGAQSFDVIDS